MYKIENNEMENKITEISYVVHLPKVADLKSFVTKICRSASVRTIYRT